ncbi:MAG: hypothetical protein ACYCOR_14955 [Acidobacteriaceae bacterium]
MIVRRFLVPLAFIVFLYGGDARAQTSWTARWLANVTATQNKQPHWITPLVLVTPRLEQEFRADFVRQLLPDNQQSWNYDNSKGLEIIPQSHIELLFNAPPYLQHSAPKTPDGLGDVSFLMKYRIISANEQRGNYILTAFFGGVVPTGTYKNGAPSSTVLPTLAGGKGWGRFDLESTLGGILPVDSVQKIGRTVVWNTVAQEHVGRYLWPEIELNSSFIMGGPNDGKKQAFIAPGLVAGRFPIRHRVGLSLGVGMQIAVTRYHAYDHALILTARIPF